MKRAIAIVILLVSFSSSVPAIELWDALPALDPMHLQGAYAARRVCPICRHGYDAGILVFVPLSTTVAKAAQLASTLAPATLVRDEARFRVFVVVTGEPSDTLLDSLRVDEPRWFVASLSGDSLGAAQRDFGTQLDDKLHAYVFSQRRLLSVLSEQALLNRNNAIRQRDIGYAIHFLNMMHPVPTSDGDPNSPQGTLWFAPSRLSSKVRRQRVTGENEAVCFAADDGSSIANAFAGIMHRMSTQQQWARTDASGCLALRGPAAGDAVLITFYRIGATELHAVIEPAETRARIVQAKKTLNAAREHIIGLPCEGCEEVFVAMPNTIGSRAPIAPAGEAGERLQLTGQVFDAKGAPAADVIVYAYQTAADGRYPRATDGNGRTTGKHGSLRGWVRTDAAGRYTFDTIRPGSYPMRRDPQHIHMHILEPSRCTYYIGDVLFDDDRRLDAQHRNKATTARGGSGIVAPRRDEHGIWHATRDIQLGRNVPGYQGCQ
jgi:protocatechuate 3,4-dioxygenase beta subunit